MDTTKLTVEQDVFVRGTSGSVWAKVISVTPLGATVETEPCYGAELLQFDKDGSIIDYKHDPSLRLYLGPIEAGVVWQNVTVTNEKGEHFNRTYKVQKSAPPEEATGILVNGKFIPVE